MGEGYGSTTTVITIKLAIKFEYEPLRIGLAGFGNVGAGVFKNLEENRQLLRERTGRDLVVTRVVVRDLSKPRDIHEIP